MRYAKNKSLITILVTIMLLAFGMVSMGYAITFPDITDSYAKTEIMSLAERGVVSGYPDGTFRPKGLATRAEFASMLVRCKGMEQDRYAASKFNDIPMDAWHAGYVGALVKDGVTSGTSETTFSPDKYITREQIVVMLIRAMDLEDEAKSLMLDSSFTDTDQISPYARDYMGLAAKTGYVKGIHNVDGSFSFKPLENVERQALCLLLYEACHNKEMYTQRTKDLTETVIIPEEAPGVAPGTDETTGTSTEATTTPAVGGGGGGGGGGGPVATKIMVNSIDVTGADNVTTITNGSSLQMVASVLPTNATNKTVTWSVTNGTGSATIDVNGLLTAAGIGTVTVKALANDGSGVYGEKEITITNVASADKTALADAIAEAKINANAPAVSTDGTDVLPTEKWVTAEELAAYQAAIDAAQAVLEDTDATQAEVDQAITDLSAATETFNAAKEAGSYVEPANTEALAAAIAEANSNANAPAVSTDGTDVLPTQQWVTAEELKAYQDAIDAAQAVLEDADATQAEVDQAITDLATATETFNAAKEAGSYVEPADKTALEDAIAEAKINLAGTKESETGTDVLPTEKWVTAEELAAYQAAIDAAQAVLEDADATQAEVDQAITDLAAATETFNAAKEAGSYVEPANTEALAAAIAEAKINANAPAVSTDGTDVLPTQQWVTAEDKIAYQAAIDAAQAVLEDTDATQDQVDQAVADLAAATETFNAAKEAGSYVEPANKTALEDAIAEAKINLAGTKESETGTDVLPTEQWVTAEELAAYQAAIDAAQAVLEDTDATQAEVDQAITDLAAATETFNAAKEAGSKRPFINGYVYYEHSSSPIEDAVISFTYKGVTYFGTSGSNGYYEVYADVPTGFLRWYEIKCKYNGVEKEWTESTLFWITHDFYYYPRDFK